MIFYEVTKKGLILPPRRGQHASCRTPCLVVLDGGRLPWRRSSRRERIRDVPLAPAPCWWCSTRVALWQNAMAAPPYHVVFFVALALAMPSGFVLPMILCLCGCCHTSYIYTVQCSRLRTMGVRRASGVPFEQHDAWWPFVQLCKHHKQTSGSFILGSRQ
jgi:hypothetical protein